MQPPFACYSLELRGCFVLEDQWERLWSDILTCSGLCALSDFPQSTVDFAGSSFRGKMVF
jgi:hypothetical protein